MYAAKAVDASVFASRSLGDITSDADARKTRRCVDPLVTFEGEKAQAFCHLGGIAQTRHSGAKGRGVRAPTSKRNQTNAKPLSAGGVCKRSARSLAPTATRSSVALFCPSSCLALGQVSTRVPDLFAALSVR